MPGVGIISNPYAGINRKNPEHNTLVWYILGNRGQFEVTQSPADLEPVCQEFKRRGIDHVGIIGGDGTICLTLEAIYNTYGPLDLPKILVLRGGTMNVVACNLGIFGKPANIMNDFLESYHSGKSLAQHVIPTLRVNGKLGFLFGNGAASRFLVEFYKSKRSPTKAALYVSKLAGGGFLGGSLSNEFKNVTASETMEIQTEPTPFREDSKQYSMVFASTVPRIPFGIKLFNQLEGAGGKAELLAVSAAGRGLVTQAMRVMAGQAPSKDVSQSQVFERGRIRMRPGSVYTIDGELFETKDGVVSFEIGPSFVFCKPYGNKS